MSILDLLSDLARPETFRPASDVNGDGEVNVNDLLQMLGVFNGDCSPAAESPPNVAGGSDGTGTGSNNGGSEANTRAAVNTAVRLQGAGRFEQRAGGRRQECRTNGGVRPAGSASRHSGQPLRSDARQLWMQHL
jgi:hypothetical protein